MREQLFAERWQVPDVAALRRAWLADLEIIGERCTCPGAYHRTWGAVKLAGRHLAIHEHAAAIDDAVRPLLARPSRILILGSADATILRLLADIGAGTGPHRFLLADRCAAPLALAREAAGERGLEVETLRHEFAEPLVLDEPVDLIFGHYVLNFLDASALAVTLSALAATLAENARMVIVHRRSMPVSQEQSWLERARCQLDSTLSKDDPVRPLAEKALAQCARERATRRLGSQDFEAAIVDAGLVVVADVALSEGPAASVGDPRLYVLAHA